MAKKESRIAPVFYPGLFDSAIQEAAIELDVMNYIKGVKGRGILDRYPTLYLCGAKLSSNNPAFYFCDSRGLPIFGLSKLRGTRRFKSTIEDTWNFVRITSYENIQGYERLHSSIHVASVVRAIKVSDSDIAADYLDIQHRYNGICRRMAENYYSLSSTRNTMQEWNLTREQQITLMALYLNKIKPEDIPDTTKATIIEVYNQLQSIASTKDTLFRNSSEMFNREKWFVMYFNDPLYYYVVAKNSAEWLYKAIMHRATSNGYVDWMSQPVAKNFYTFKSLDSVPNEIKNDFNSAIAMYKMGSKISGHYVDPCKLIPYKDYINQELGACTYVGSGSSSTGLLVMDV